MKRILSIILVSIMLMVPVKSFAAEEEQAVKALIKGYVDLKYKALSTLTYHKQIENFISPGVLNAKEAINEGQVLETAIKYRKAQINDLRFDRYKVDIQYDSIKFEGDKTWASFTESYELYFKCAPTVKNSAQVTHSMMLSKTHGSWLMISDDYMDSDGIKKKLTKYFIEDNLTMDVAQEKVLEASLNQAEGRLKKLESLGAGLADKDAYIFYEGKTIAYAKGSAQKIDQSKNISPVSSKDTVLLPLRYLCEKEGLKVGWEDGGKVKVSDGNGFNVLIKVGDSSVYVNDKKVGLKSPAKLVNGVTMVPVEAAAQLLDKKYYVDDKGLVILTKGSFGKNSKGELIKNLQEFFQVLFTKADFPRIDGSTATYPFSMEMGKELLGLDDTGVRGSITHNTTHDAYVNLINGHADIIFVTQPSPEEYQLAKEKGVELEVVPMCKEGFVFLVNKDNAVNGLSTKEIQDIYQGKIKNWRDVGGENVTIIPYQRDANSGSQTLMENTVMKGLKLMRPPRETLVYGMGELIDRVADYSNARNALGYSVYYYATTMYANRNVKLLSVDGVMPQKESIKNGKYPFTVGYYAVVRKDEPKDSNARKLLAWVLGAEGQKVVDRAGFVAVD